MPGTFLHRCIVPLNNYLIGKVEKPLIVLEAAGFLLTLLHMLWHSLKLYWYSEAITHIIKACHILISLDTCICFLGLLDEEALLPGGIYFICYFYLSMQTDSQKVAIHKCTNSGEMEKPS